MLLGIVCVWEYTIISSQKEEIKSKELLIDAQAVRARDLQQQIVEKDNTVKLLTTTPQKPTQNTPTTQSVPSSAVSQPAQSTPAQQPVRQNIPLQ